MGGGVAVFDCNGDGFEDMFLAPQVTTFQQPASKYLIIERQYPASEQEISRQFSSYDGFQQELSRKEVP